VTQTVLASIVGLTTIAVVACCTGVQPVAAQAHPPAGMAASGDADGSAGADFQAPITGKVVETMNSGGYTYVQIDDGSKKIWAAGPPSTVAVGDQVIVGGGMLMRDFSSKTLGRTFDLIYFAPAIQVVGAQLLDKMAAAHGAAGQGVAGHGAAGYGAADSMAPAAAVDLSNIKKADGGQTVAELFANKAALAGKEIVVRGRVVKFTPAVMGKNWVHLRDGSGSTGTNDLAVSTSANAAVGNLVLVRGTLGTDRDLGAGYHYDIIIEDAALAVE
jgi:hypothetical protein